MLMIVFSRPLWSDPVEVVISGSDGGNTTVYSSPPPGSGPVLAFILNVLDEYDLNSTSLEPENEVLTYQRITETFKYAYALRTYLGDPEFVNVADVSGVNQLRIKKQID